MNYDLHLTYIDGSTLPMRLPDDHSLADALAIANGYASQDIALALDGPEVERVVIIGRDGHGGRWEQARVYGKGYGINLSREHVA